MGELLEDLKDLQAVALKLAGIEQDLEARQRRVANRQRLVKLADERLDQNNRTARQYQIRIDQLSVDVAAREESQNKHRQALNQARTNKDYAAILTAMNTERADTAKIEAAVFELMKEVENLDAAATKIAAERAAAVEEVERAIKAFDAARQKCQSELDALRARREEFAERLPHDALAVFDRAASRHDGEAMAEVVKPAGKRGDYNCGGCNMTITLEVVNALQSRDDVQRCGSCGRILYLETAATTR